MLVNLLCRDQSESKHLMEFDGMLGLRTTRSRSIKTTVQDDLRRKMNYALETCCSLC